MAGNPQFKQETGQQQFDASGNLKVNVAATTGDADKQYTEGDVDSTITGTAAMGESAGNVLDVIQLDASKNLKVAVNVALPAGTAAIGKLAANDGVDIGDVTINNASGGSAVNIQDGGNSITVDGTVTATIAAGASTIAKNEDAAHASGDTGVMALGVRNDLITAPTTLSDTNGDYTPLATTKEGYQPGVNAVLEVSFTTTTAQAVASTDCAIYRYVSVHIVTQGTNSTVNFQGSNDNTNWSVIKLSRLGDSNFGTSDTNANSINVGVIPFRYFRLNVTGISAGTTAGVVEFFAYPLNDRHLTVVSGNNGLATSAQLTTSIGGNVLGMPDNTDATAPSSNSDKVGVVGRNYLFSSAGATWQRARAMENSVNSLGTGVAAVGLLAQLDDTSPSTVTENSFGNVRMDASRILYSNTEGQKTTYSASITALAPAVAATDIFTLTGSGTKTIRITRVQISGVATAAGAYDIVFLKRSTANSAGTSTAPAVVPHDSTNAAGTATPLAYTANPTLGTLVGNLQAKKITVSTAAGAIPIVPTELNFGNRPEQTIVLRGTGQVFAINLAATTMTGGSLDIDITWSEE